MKDALIRLGKLIAFPILVVLLIPAIVLGIILSVIHIVLWAIQLPLWYVVYGKEACQWEIDGPGTWHERYKIYPLRYAFELAIDKTAIIFTPFEKLFSWKW